MHPAALVAHQGGWDEVLLVIVPLLFFAVLLVVANKRAGALDADDDADDTGDGPTA